MARRGLWTGLRLEQISRQLGRLGFAVCPNTVRRLLEEMDYALRANRKSLSGQQSPERDRQFRYLQVQRQEFTRQGLPIISVDTKKKEMVGAFKNAGQVWSREPIPVNDHDFRSLAKGMAIRVLAADVRKWDMDGGLGLRPDIFPSSKPLSPQAERADGSARAAG